MERNSNTVLAMLIIFVLIGLIIAGMFATPVWKVWQQEKEGQAILAKAESARKVLVTQAAAEREAAVLRAEAISIVGKAAKEFPEYRQQEFIGAFAEALQRNQITQIIYVPTEANIPIIPANETARLLTPKR